MKRAIRSLLTVGALALLLAGCSESKGVSGSWQLTKSVEGEFSTMTLTEDGKGTAKLLVPRTIMGIITVVNYDHEVDYKERETSFDFDWVCTASPYEDGCEETDNFDLDCELKGDEENELSCDSATVAEDAMGTSDWSHFDFTWTRVGGE